MSTRPLTPDELCVYFESFTEGRRAVVWARCERQIGCPIEDLDHENTVDSARLDEIFDQVITDLWVADHLDRLTRLGVLEREITADGQFSYHSP